MLELLEHTEPLHKVTIIPRGPSLGSTMWLPEEDKYTNRKNELIAGLAVGMGGLGGTGVGLGLGEGVPVAIAVSDEVTVAKEKPACAKRSYDLHIGSSLPDEVRIVVFKISAGADAGWPPRAPAISRSQARR